MFGLGTTEMIIVALVVLLLFGSRLPSVMRSLGRGVVEFKKGVSGIEDEIQHANDKKAEDRTTDEKSAQKPDESASASSD